MMASAANGFDFDLYSSIGEILVRRGDLTRKQLRRAIMVSMRTKRKIGDVVVDMGLCSRFDVNAALDEQRALRPPSDGAGEKALDRLSVSVDRACFAAQDLQRTVLRDNVFKISPDHDDDDDK